MKSAEEWLTFTEGDEILLNEDFIRAIQADAIEAAAQTADLSFAVAGFDPVESCISKRIRALKPGTPPPRAPTDEATDKLRAMGLNVGATPPLPRYHCGAINCVGHGERVINVHTDCPTVIAGSHRPRSP